MSDLRDLYQEVILDHGKSPRNFRENPAANRVAKGFNPLCGDRVQVFAVVDGDVVTDVSFQGQGCAISQASVSMMTQILKGKTLAEAKNLFERFHDLITSSSPANVEGLGKLAVFAGVREYPNRAKCATLGWHTMNAAIDNQGDTVSTE